MTDNLGGAYESPHLSGADKRRITDAAKRIVSYSMQPNTPSLAQARALLAAVEKRCGESVATDDATMLLSNLINNSPSRHDFRTRSAIAVLQMAVLLWTKGRHYAGPELYRWHMLAIDCDLPALAAALEACDGK